MFMSYVLYPRIPSLVFEFVYLSVYTKMTIRVTRSRSRSCSMTLKFLSIYHNTKLLSPLSQLWHNEGSCD